MVEKGEGFDFGEEKGGYFRWFGTLKGLAALIMAAFVLLVEYSRWS